VLIFEGTGDKDKEGGRQEASRNTKKHIPLIGCLRAIRSPNQAKRSFSPMA
jgi:hypothetical protein